MAELEAEAKRLRQRPSESVGRIARDPRVPHNAPAVAGTRIPTAAIWDLHRAGHDTAAILRAFPTLQPEDVEAAVAYEERERARLAG